jgi:hypothetical protein
MSFIKSFLISFNLDLEILEKDSLAASGSSNSLILDMSFTS